MEVWHGAQSRKFIQALSWDLLKLKDMTKHAGMATHKNLLFFPFFASSFGEPFQRQKSSENFNAG